MACQLSSPIYLSSSSPVALQKAKVLSAFYVAGESRMRVTEEISTRWFTGTIFGSWGAPDKVFAVYRATFRGRILLSEECWHLPGEDGWEPTTRISEWFFVGNDRIDESTETEVAKYLAEGKLSTLANEIISIPPNFHSEELSEILEFSTKFDGYAHFGDDLGEIANKTMNEWRITGVLPRDQNLIQACLFFEGRRGRFVSGYPNESDMPYLRALCNAVIKK